MCGMNHLRVIMLLKLEGKAPTPYPIKNRVNNVYFIFDNFMALCNLSPPIITTQQFTSHCMQIVDYIWTLNNCTKQNVYLLMFFEIFVCLIMQMSKFQKLNLTKQVWDWLQFIKNVLKSPQPRWTEHTWPPGPACDSGCTSLHSNIRH